MPTTYAIPNGRTVMDATTYTGTGAAQNITNQAGFKPDLVWTKSRNNAVDNCLIDSVRGTSIALKSNLSNAEDNAGAPYYVTSFNTNGFGVNQGTGSGASGYTYVGWQWQAGQGTTSTNTAGAITSTVSANVTAGFSIVTWTGTGSGNTTVGHGLGAVPKLYITKNRNNAGDWGVFFPDTFTGTPTQNKFMYLDTTASAGNASQSLPTSTVLSLNGGFENASGNNYVAYCWIPIAGYSAFGSYTGNGSTDGPFLYFGFRPKFYMYKRTDSTSNWVIMDSTRNPYNAAGLWLYPNLSNAENDVTSTDQWDFLSNGLKVRSNGSATNANGGTYIYAAFAENPFKYSNAR